MKETEPFEAARKHVERVACGHVDVDLLLLPIHDGHGSAIVGSKGMSQRAGTAEAEIKALIEAWADAVRRHDLPAILAHHDDDIVMFDVPPPLQSRGMAAYKKTWDLFFAYHRTGQAFDVDELQICVGDTVAFAVAIMRCGSATVSGPPVPGGFQFRLTIGLCKVDGAWCIQHEHHSVPATD